MYERIIYTRLFPGDETNSTVTGTEGATHFDYMRETNGSTWNVTVSDFVTKLLIASKTKDDLQLFLDSSPYVSPPDATGKRVVRLPGWEAHT